MNKKNDVEVIINGKKYNMGGYESEEYLQRVASYINSKYAELKKEDSYRTLDEPLRNILLQINLADDYFKLKKQVQETETDSDVKSNQIFELKHDIVSLQTKLEKAEAEIESLRNENIEAQKQIVRLETELNEKRRRP